MESTGVFSKPVWHVFEEHFTLVLANAMHILNVPGLKSVLNGATWIADLLALGLIRSSFVPPAPIQELRDLDAQAATTRASSRRHVLRIQKALVEASLKLTQVMSDSVGVCGRAILQRADRWRDRSRALADLTAAGSRRHGPIWNSLHRCVTDHHPFMIIAPDPRRRARDRRRDD